MKYTILIVDDEQANLRLLERLLSPDYKVIVADSGAAALTLLTQHQCALIISDQRMPGMTGIEFLKRASEIAPQSVRIIITGYTDAEALVEAVNSGVVYKYVTKPWINSDLKVTIQRGLQHHETQRAQRNLQEKLTTALSQVDEARSSLIQFAAAFLNIQDPSAFARASRIAKLAIELGRRLELPAAELESLELAIIVKSLLSVGLPQSNSGIGNSVDQALKAVKRFETGVQILSDVQAIRSVIASIRQFNERYDGSGYPNRLFGEAICPIARIGAIVTTFDEMTAADPASPRADTGTAIDDLRSAAGTKFDPRMVGEFASLIENTVVKPIRPNGAGNFPTQLVTI